MNLVSISTGKFFKDNKIARARRASAIRSLWKVYRGLLHQIAREIILLLVNNVYEKKNHKKSRQTILWQRALAICNSHSCYKLVGTRVMDLYSCYLRMYSFSANQKRVVFFMYIIKEQISISCIVILSWLYLLPFQAKEKENRTPLNMSISGGQHAFYLSDNGLVGNSTFKYHQLTVGSTYRFWSAVGNKNGGVMKRSPSENIVICDGTFEEPDDSK